MFYVMWHVEYLWSPCVFNFAILFNIGYVLRTVSKTQETAWDCRHQSAACSTV